MSFVDMDDDIDIDYTPSIVSNSRSAGMKYNLFYLEKSPEKLTISQHPLLQKNKMISIYQMIYQDHLHHQQKNLDSIMENKQTLMFLKIKMILTAFSISHHSLQLIKMYQKLVL